MYEKGSFAMIKHFTNRPLFITDYGKSIFTSFLKMELFVWFLEPYWLIFNKNGLGYILKKPCCIKRKNLIIIPLPIEHIMSIRTNDILFICYPGNYIWLTLYYLFTLHTLYIYYVVSELLHSILKYFVLCTIHS